MKTSDAVDLMKVALRPNLINQWAQSYYKGGGVIKSNDTPISFNCLVSRYLNDSFKHFLDDNQKFAIYVATGAFTVDHTVEEKIHLQPEIKILVHEFDRACAKKNQKYDTNADFTLQEILQIIKIAHDKWAEAYDPTKIEEYGLKHAIYPHNQD